VDFHNIINIINFDAFVPVLWQTTNKYINQSINQSIKSINQSINQSSIQPPSFFLSSPSLSLLQRPFIPECI